MSERLPLPPGTIVDHELPPAEEVRPVISGARIKAAGSLGELSRELVFFTPALLYTHAQLDRDPVQDFVQEVSGNPWLVGVSFKNPLFSGLKLPDGNPFWEHRLYLIEVGYWERCLAYLGTIGVADPRRRLFAKADPYVLNIVDPLAVDKATVLPDPLPRVDICVLGLIGNRGTYRLEPPQDPFPTLPWVCRTPPDPAFSRKAQRLLKKMLRRREK